MSLQPARAHQTRMNWTRAIANGVPFPMGRAVARAVKAALGITSQAVEEAAERP